jgi:trigger factor
LSSTVKKISSVLTGLDITITADEIGKAADKRLQQLSKTARVSGFRRGRLPKSVAKKMFGKSVYMELMPDLTYKAFLAALSEHDLSPVGEPEFSNLDAEMKEGEDYKFTAKVETAPRLEKIITEGIELKRDKIVVEPDMVDKELKRLQSSLATSSDIEKPRKIKKGDAVKLEMRKKEDNGEWSANAMPEQEIIIEEATCPKELLAALPGKNIGDEIEVEFGDGDDKTPFLCKVTAHMERILPKIDDDFARDLGTFETLAELKADIEKKYVEHIKNNQKSGLKQQLFDALREKNPMELPPAILAKQTDAMREQYDGIAKQIDDKISKNTGKDGKNTDKAASGMDDSAKKAASEIVHTHFLIQDIARQEKLEVTAEDLEAHYAEMAAATGLPVARIKAEYAKSEYGAEIEGRIIEDKVFDFISQKVKIVEVEPSENKKADESSDK